MADQPFNPEPPNVQPDNYINWSRPIEEPKADTSTEIGLKGLGSAIEGGTQLGIAGEENSIRQDVYAKKDTLDQDYIQRLSQADSVLGKPDSGDTPPSGGSPGLKNLPQSLDVLHSASQNGKITEKYYYQQLYSMAKEMRSENPMFKDYIDQQFSRVTREQPANDLIKSLTSDINTYTANAREQQNKTGNMIDSAIEKGLLGNNGGSVKAGFNAGLISGTAVQNMISASASRHYQNELTLQGLQINREKTALDAETGASKMSPVIANQVLDFTDAKTIPFGGSYIGLRDLYTKIQNKEITPTPDQDTGYARVAQSQRSDIYTKMWSMMNDTSRGPSVVQQQYGGSLEKAKAALDVSMKPMDDLVSLYTDKQLGVAGLAEAHIKDVEAGSQAAWYDSAKYGQGIAKIKGLSTILGNSDVGKSWLGDVATPPAGLSKDIQGLFTHQMTSIATQSTGDSRAPNPGDSVKLGQPITLQQSIESAKNQGYTGPRAAPMYKGWVDTIAYGLGNTKMPAQVRSNLAAGAYGAGNDNLMFNFQPDTRNAKGQRVPGSTSAFTTLVNPKITKAMYELGGPTIQGDEPWTAYKNRAVKWFGDTFHQNIQTLNSLQDSDYVKILWDPENQQFTTRFTNSGQTDKPPTVITLHSIGNAAAGAMYSLENYRIQTPVDNINRGLEAMKSIAKKDPSVDMNSTLISLLTGQGLDPTGVSQKLKNAVTKAAQAEVSP